jgi:hypothetical protein
MRVLIFSTTFIEIFLIIKRIRRDIVINVKSLHVKYLLFLADFSSNLNFLDKFSKKKKL